LHSCSPFRLRACCRFQIAELERELRKFKAAEAKRSRAAAGAAVTDVARAPAAVSTAVASSTAVI
jgi:hypothetical protein